MGGAVSVHTHDETRNEMIKHLLADPEALNNLFEEIAGKQESQEGRINNADQISLVEIITFFNASEDPCFEGFGVHASIAKQALRYTETHSKKKKRYKDQISHKQFKVFLPTMFLFAHLWKIFESELDTDIDDKRIFKHEFMQSRPSLKKINGADISDDVTDEVWEQEFHKIDINKNGFISFGEFCKYVTKFIVTPKKFVEDITNEKHDMFEEDPGNNDDSVAATTDAPPAVESAGVTSSSAQESGAVVSTSVETTNPGTTDAVDSVETMEPVQDVAAPVSEPA